jgi:TonB family protein
MKKPSLLILFVILCLSTHAQNNDTLKKNQSVDTLHSVIKGPEFPGGKESLKLFVMRNCHYPAISFEENKQGEVVIQVLIDKDGHPSSLTVIKSVSPAIDKELARVMSTSPRWIPGSMNGNPVQAIYTIPITFTINGNLASIIPH